MGGTRGGGEGGGLEVAVLEAVATETAGCSEEGGEDECALSMTKKRVCQGVKDIHEVFAAFA
jgi:hypothetical protein